MKTILLFPFVFAFVACSSPEKSTVCQERDWYEIGRQRGVKGHQIQMEEFKLSCADSDAPANQALYQNGYRAGIVEFCTQENGFELGRRGQTLNHICPTNLFSQFKSGYFKGRKARKLEKSNEKIEQEINLLFSRLQAEELSKMQRSQLKLKLRQRRRDRQANRIKIEELERSTLSTL